MKPSKISKNQKRLFLYILLGIIIAYIGYQMIDYYTAEEKTSVSIKYTPSETNIISKVTAKYTMKQGQGSLKLSKDFTDSSALPYGCVSSFVELSTTDGDTVTKAGLTFEYDEKFLETDEENLVIVRISENKKEAYPVETKLDKDNNTLYANTSAAGKWAVADKAKLKE
ncbi:MAG: hypothetical protein II998_12940 [Clostridia bacterium]|nr:hypothetical protein [Clostridia bacterium]